MSTYPAILLLAMAYPASLPVQGIVRGENGEPVAGALVFLYSEGRWRPTENELAVRSITGPDGRFAISEPVTKPLLQDTERILLAYKPGDGVAAVGFDARRIPMQTVALTLWPFAPVRVRVVDPNGRPMAGAAVRLTSFSVPSGSIPTTPVSTPQFARRTSAEGDVTLEVARPAGELSVRVETREFGVQHATFDGQVELNTLRLLPVGSISGGLDLEDPRVGAGIRIRVSSAVPGPRTRVWGTAETRVDGEGRFRIPALAAGDIRISSLMVSDESRYLLPDEIRVPLVADEAKVVTLKCVPGIRERGKVLDEQGNPVAGIRLQTGWQSLGQPPRSTEGIFITDSQGAYEWNTFPGHLQAHIDEAPAPWISDAPSTGLSTLEQNSVDWEFPPIRMKRGVAITGKVIDERNRPVPEAAVEAIWSVGEGQDERVFWIATRSDERGDFTFGAVTGTGLVELRARNESRGSVEYRIVDAAKADERTGVRLTIAPEGLITISGRVVDADGESVSAVRMERWGYPLKSSGARWSRGWTEFTGQQAILTGTDGKFRTPGLSRLSAYSVMPNVPSANGVNVPVTKTRESEIVLPEIKLRPPKF